MNDENLQAMAAKVDAQREADLRALAEGRFQLGYTYLVTETAANLLEQLLPQAVPGKALVVDVSILRLLREEILAIPTHAITGRLRLVGADEMPPNGKAS